MQYGTEKDVERVKAKATEMIEKMQKNAEQMSEDSDEEEDE